MVVTQARMKIKNSRNILLLLIATQVPGIDYHHQHVYKATKNDVLQYILLWLIDRNCTTSIAQHIKSYKEDHTKQIPNTMTVFTCFFSAYLKEEMQPIITSNKCKKYNTNDA